ncbi:uncharacterized protein IL334_005029 [Kwoniella shivajii]|uniref:Phorbol-ester/DAG-type domain-containing protein n=1 Tax=Kwoniella shivajii TaxID=564305 RepID=A0ABZ1D3F3_9TREE|nr:hypothetical protein IL334_005029 [Kwoniella shivajii]
MASRRESNADRNLDGRRALGIRPGGQPPPRLFLERPSIPSQPPSPTLPLPSSPKSPTTTRNVSISIPAIPIPPSPTFDQPKRFRRPTISSKSKPSRQTSNRGLYETQKLLSHLLDRLESRDAAPDLLERAAISAREISGKHKNKSKGKVQRLGNAIAAAAHSATIQSPTPTSGSANTSTVSPMGAGMGMGVGSEDYEDVVLTEGEIDVEITYDLVEQTRGLLVLADKQGLDLFDDDEGGRPSIVGVPILDSTPVKNKRKAGRFSSIAPSNSIKPSFSSSNRQEDTPPRASTSTSISGQMLLARILNILQTLLTVDCLHRTHLFRPLCPPLALQSACLDIASYLYAKSKKEPIKIRIVGMVVDGLYGMTGMLERVCEWLEGRISELLIRLARDRGGPGTKDKTEDMGWTDPFSTKSAPGKAVPTFAISTESQDTLPPPNLNTPGWMRYSPTSPSFPFFPPGNVAGLLSTHAAKDASDTTIEIASLVPKILLGLSTMVDMTSSKFTTIHRVHRLLSLILTAKPDSSLDLLEIVAHAPPAPRRTALEILSTFYPGAIGHNSISRRLANTTYSAHRAKWETGQDRALGEDDESHYFIPWRSSSKDDCNQTSPKCGVCATDIHGFALRCTLCRELRHLHCYHSAGVNTYDVITLSSDDTTPQMVHVKYSLSPPRLDEQILYGSTLRGSPSSTRRKVGQHDLVLVSIFNLTLCEECHLPLWGIATQAYGCTNGCQRFFHYSCLDQMEKSNTAQCRYGRDVVIDEISAQGKNPFSISLSLLEQSFDQSLKPLYLNSEELSRKTYDEMAVVWGYLWIQYQILKNGLTSSSLRITSHDTKLSPDILGFEAILKLYEEQLKSRSSESSPASSDFCGVVGSDYPLGQGYMFSDKFLSYIIALLRAPSSTNHGGGSGTHTPSDGLLTPVGLLAPEQEVNEGSFEMLPLSILSSSLSSDLGISDPRITVIFLNQLRSLGLMSVSNKLSIKEIDLKSPSTWAGFGLPLLMDNSPTIELLVSSIEVLLLDLDLSMNEVGLRLLETKAWSSGLCSPYALERLGKGLVDWIMSQDESLLQVVKLYASRHKRLPGVKNPIGSNLKGQTSVNLYKDDRIRLMKRYAVPWLKGLHDLDPNLYAAMVYEECKNPLPVGKLQSENEEPSDQLASKMAGIALERMTAVVDANVVFSTLMELVTAWLEDLGALADQDVVYRSLPRLLRHSTSNSSPSSSFDQTDLFSLSLSVSQSGPEGLIRACRWLRVLSFSGVEIPWNLLIDLVELQSTTRSEVEARLDLVIAVGANGMALEPEAFAGLCAKVSKGIFVDLGKGGGNELTIIELDLVRQSMLLVLRAYGVPLDDVAQTSLNTGELQTKQPASMSKKRRVNSGRTTFALDKAMVLSAASILERTNYPCEMVLDFLWLLFTKAAMIDNVDGFIHRACPRLYELIWPLVDFAIDRKSRARVLLRMLSVNPNSLEKIVRQELDSSPEERAKVRERILTFVLDLADSSVVYELSTWQSSAVGLILLLFDVLSDTAEMISDNLVILQALLPTHLKAMSMCFEDYLIRHSDEKRLILLTRLRRLRLTLPTWPIISWKMIEGLLAEQVASITQLRPGRSSQTMSALMDSQSVRCSLLSLGMDMLSSGVPISWITAQRFQQHVASCLALPWTNPIEGITSLVLPAIRGVLDSSTRITISGQTFDNKSKKTALVGSLFVPVVIDLGSELGKFEYLTQRTILDSLMATFFKQNVRSVELAALSALQTLAQFVATTECAENRLLALQILQIAVVRMERESVIRAVPSVFATIAGVLVKENEAEYADSAVLEQSRVFLRGIVMSFGRSGLFLQLFRIDDNAITGAQEQSSLGRAVQLLHASDKVVQGQPTLFDNVFHNLSDVLKRGKQTIDQVLVSLCRFSESLQVELSEDVAENYGMFIARLGKHIAEWDPQEFDPNPILKSCASILDLVQPVASIPLLHQISTFLHLTLTRFGVSQATLSRLLTVSERIARGQSTEDTIRTVSYELAGSTVHGLNVAPVTLLTLLNFLAINASREHANSADLKSSSQQARVLADSAPGCVQILLRSHPTFAIGNIEPEISLGILMQAGTVLCKAEMAVKGIISQSLSNITVEAASTQINSFIYILLASFDLSMGSARKRIISLYPILARAASLCLRASADFLTLQDTTGDGAELLSLVFVVFRLSILALHDITPVPQGEIMKSDLKEDAMDIYWSRIWTDWFRLLTISLDPTCINGPLKAVSHSVYQDTIIFLGQNCSPILSKHSGTLSHALGMLVRHQELLAAASSGSGTSTVTGTAVTSGKMQKAAQVLDRISTGIGIGNPTEVDKLTMINTIKKDLGATERLKALRNIG